VVAGIGEIHDRLNVSLDQDAQFCPQSWQVRSRRISHDPALEQDQIGAVGYLGQVGVGLDWNRHDYRNLNHSTQSKPIDGFMPMKTITKINSAIGVSLIPKQCAG
jgi:hypothetical protein